MLPAMTISAFAALACPLDSAPLTREVACWRCTNGHAFDIASEGYVHLLPVQFKRSRDPGDSKAMILARRRFLEAGYYQAIADWVSRWALAGARDGGPLACLDAGCGEGFYLRQLADAAALAGIPLQLAGLDISKWAVQAAARKLPAASWLVGTNARLPVLAATLDRVLCLFGFPVFPEFARVLRPGGELLLVDPGPDHLRELREIIYPSLKPSRETVAEAPAGFVAMPGDRLRCMVRLPSAEAIADLLVMTPHLYRASAEGRARAAAMTTLTLTLDLRLTRWQRI